MYCMDSRYPVDIPNRVLRTKTRSWNIRGTSLGHPDSEVKIEVHREYHLRSTLRRVPASLDPRLPKVTRRAKGRSPSGCRLKLVLRPSRSSLPSYAIAAYRGAGFPISLPSRLAAESVLPQLTDRWGSRVWRPREPPGRFCSGQPASVEPQSSFGPTFGGFGLFGSPGFGGGGSLSRRISTSPRKIW